MFGPHNIEGEPPIAGAVVNFDVVRNQEVQRWKISHFFQLPKLNFLLFFIISLTSDFAPSILFHLYFSLNRDWKLWIGFRGRSFFTMSLLDSTCWIGGSVISSVSFSSSLSDYECWFLVQLRFFLFFFCKFLYGVWEYLCMPQPFLWGFRYICILISISVCRPIFHVGFELHPHVLNFW